MKMLQCVLAAVALTFVAVGCEVGPGTVDAQAPGITLGTTQGRITAGESTTLFANTENLLGREHEIEWSTTLGEIEPLREGRMARFTSEDAGTAVVTAVLTVNGQQIRDSVNVQVDAFD